MICLYDYLDIWDCCELFLLVLVDIYDVFEKMFDSNVLCDVIEELVFIEG